MTSRYYNSIDSHVNFETHLNDNYDQLKCHPMETFSGNCTSLCRLRLPIYWVDNITYVQLIKTYVTEHKLPCDELCNASKASAQIIAETFLGRLYIKHQLDTDKHYHGHSHRRRHT